MINQIDHCHSVNAPSELPNQVSCHAMGSLSWNDKAVLASEWMKSISATRASTWVKPISARGMTTLPTPVHHDTHLMFKFLRNNDAAFYAWQTCLGPRCSTSGERMTIGQYSAGLSVSWPSFLNMSAGSASNTARSSSMMIIQSKMTMRCRSVLPR